jgi:hypothetical protein
LRLSDLLAQIAERALAERAWVIDRDSPVLWAGSHRSILETVNDALLDPEENEDLALDALPPAERACELRSIRAIQALRAGDWPAREGVYPIGEGAVAYARTFANIYALLLVFAEGYSELHAQAAAVRSLPLVEKLVLGLPPQGPISERRRRPR